MSKQTGKRIKRLRNKYNISQQELADHLKLKRVSISQIETGKRKLTDEEIKKISEFFGVSSDSILGLKKFPEVVLEKEEQYKTKKQEIRINVPQKNLKKFKEVLLYILNKVGAKPNIGETVLYKLLYFIDFNFYEKYEEQLIGATYIKNKYGPTPREFITIVEETIKNNEIEKIDSEFYQYPQTKYLPRRREDSRKLKAHEIKVIDDVLNKYSDMTAKKISEHSHRDVPWMAAEDGEVIEYESVFYRTPEFSVANDE